MEIVIPYEPRPLQRQLHDSVKRFSVVVTHRRFGKTIFAINHLLRAALTCTLEAPRYGYIAPFRDQAKSIAWDYLKRYAGVIPGVAFNESELRADLPNGSRIRLFGADNYHALRGLYFDGVVLDETAQIAPVVWQEVVRPALSDRRGFAIFTGTPLGKNFFWELLDKSEGQPDWFSAVFPASRTQVVDAAELDAARREMGADRFAQEYECSFEAAIQGAYYADLLSQAEKDGRIAGVPYEPRAEVWTAWDLGIDDCTSIWFVQVVGREWRVIDHYEASGAGLEHYVKVLRDKPYIYAGHLLPHDAEVKELGTGLSRMETLAGLGLRNARVVPLQRVEDGIQAVRTTIPKCWFDATKCKRGLEALRQYRKEWDDKTQTFRVRPLHDWTSHAADAFRYLALGLRVEEPMKPLKYNDGWIV